MTAIVQRAQSEPHVERAAEPEPAIEVSVVTAITGPAEIDAIMDAYSKQLRQAGRAFEFMFVLDGPHPAEAEVLERRRLASDPVRWISFRQSFGETLAIAAGIEEARGKWIITSPSYLQIDPYEIHRMLQELDSGCDLVCTWRHPRKDPYLNRIQSSLFNVLLRWLVKIPFHDLNCNFRAIRRDMMREISIYGDQFRFLPLMALRQGYRVKEIRVRHMKERGRKGFFGFGVYLRRFLDVLAVLFLTKFALKPLRFFGLIGSVFSVFGLAVLAIVTYDKLWQGKEIGDRPLFILGVVMVVLGAQVIGFGLVGEIIIFTQAKNIREYRIEKIEG